MKRISLRLAGALGAALLLNATLDAAPVRVEGGLLSGVAADGVIAYKGIPYAAPPVGDLRWRAPQPAAPWPGVRAADAYGHDCMQEPFPSDAAPLGTPPAEDCLYANVWAPEKSASPKLPVMVWIHGGGFVNGGASPAVYDGRHFARRGVVFVSFNHRLGRFGFFAHPALSAENPKGPLGNYGYLDQIAALKWVQKNVAAFGGDPGNVTVFGESAGGGSVHTLMVSPLAKGLFHKAIVESGGGRAGGIMAPRSLKEAEAVGVAFAKLAGVTGEDAAALAALRKLPAPDLVRGLNLMSMRQQRDTWSGPMTDGQIVVEEPETAFRAGRQASVPYMVGANSREFAFAHAAAAVEGMLARFGAEKEKVVAAYDPEKTGNMAEVGIGVMSDGAMVEPARLLARLASAAGQPTYAYRFSYVASSIRKNAKGAPPRDRDPVRLRDGAGEVRRRDDRRGRGARRRRERLLGRVRADRRPGRRRPPEVARLLGEGRRDHGLRDHRTGGEGRPLEGAAGPPRARGREAGTVDAGGGGAASLT